MKRAKWQGLFMSFLKKIPRGGKEKWIGCLCLVLFWVMVSLILLGQGFVECSRFLGQPRIAYYKYNWSISYLCMLRQVGLTHGKNNEVLKIFGKSPYLVEVSKFLATSWLTCYFCNIWDCHIVNPLWYILVLGFTKGLLVSIFHLFNSSREQMSRLHFVDGICRIQAFRACSRAIFYSPTMIQSCLILR